MKIFGLVGASGFGREVMPIARQNEYIQTKNIETVFVDQNIDKASIGNERLVNEEDFLKLEQHKYFNIAIADWKIRKKVANHYTQMGCQPLQLIASNVLTYDRVEIDKGAIICSRSHITSDVKIGKYFHCNIYSYVAHDCRIGDFVTFGPKVFCNGNVQIKDYAYIGTGAILKQGTPEKPLVIGEGAVVGMGAVVLKDVAPNSVVVGNPAKVIDNRFDIEQIIR